MGICCIILRTGDAGDPRNVENHADTHWVSTFVYFGTHRGMGMKGLYLNRAGSTAGEFQEEGFENLKLLAKCGNLEIMQQRIFYANFRKHGH